MDDLYVVPKAFPLRFDPDTMPVTALESIISSSGKNGAIPPTSFTMNDNLVEVKRTFTDNAVVIRVAVDHRCITIDVDKPREVRVHFGPEISGSRDRSDDSRLQRFNQNTRRKFRKRRIVFSLGLNIAKLAAKSVTYAMQTGKYTETYTMKKGMQSAVRTVFSLRWLPIQQHYNLQTRNHGYRSVNCIAPLCISATSTRPSCQLT